MDNTHKNLILVTGGFSGIQDTVYTISSKGALKSLRARSFMLELLTEHIVFEIMKYAGMKNDKPEDYLIRLMPDNGKVKPGVLYSGGGSFSLILENIDEIKPKVENYADLLNCWAFYEFSGKLFIEIHVLETNETELAHEFQKLRRMQAEALEKSKTRKFMTGNNELLKTILTPKMPVQTDNEKQCQISGRDDLPADALPKELKNWPDNRMREIQDGFRVSSSNYHLWHIGDDLTMLEQGKKIYRYDYESVKDISLKGCICFPSAVIGKYAVYSIQKLGQGFEKSWIVGNDFYYAYYAAKIRDIPKYAQNRELKAMQQEQPEITLDKMIKQNYTASFTGLAACSCGADMIGALRMDVDDLGRLFSGISDYRELAKLSYRFNYFFKNVLNDICNGSFEDSHDIQTNILKEQGRSKRNVSIIYAGGDDLFIAGAWNELVELAFDIQKCFVKYCTEHKIKNPVNGSYGSISGGLTLHHPRFPLYQMAKCSGQAEHEAKTGVDKNDSPGKEKKNRISLFYDLIKTKQKFSQKNSNMLSMNWNKAYDYLLPLMGEFIKLGDLKNNDNQKKIFEVNKISYQTIEKWYQVTEKFQGSGQLYLPTLARVMYDIRKNLEPRLFNNLLKYLYCGEKSDISQLHTALNWLTYLRRVQ